jgi:hypothetical protein
LKRKAHFTELIAYNRTSGSLWFAEPATEPDFSETPGKAGGSPEPDREPKRLTGSLVRPFLSLERGNRTKAEPRLNQRASRRCDHFRTKGEKRNRFYARTRTRGKARENMQISAYVIRIWGRQVSDVRAARLAQHFAQAVEPAPCSSPASSFAEPAVSGHDSAVPDPQNGADSARLIVDQIIRAAISAAYALTPLRRTHSGPASTIPRSMALAAGRVATA